MEKIYLAVAYGGSYEDSWENNIVASADPEKIRQYVAEQTARVERLKDVEIKTSRFAIDYDKFNPLDRSAMEPTVDLPKWPAGMDQRLITREMRAERDSIRAFNAEVAARNHARIAEHNARRQEALLAFAISAGLDVADLPNSEEGAIANAFGIMNQLYHATDIKYRVDEVDVL